MSLGLPCVLLGPASLPSLDSFDGRQILTFRDSTTRSVADTSHTKLPLVARQGM